MQRVRVVSVQTSDEQGGGEYANVDLLDGLAGRGADVVLVTNQEAIAEGTRVPTHHLELGPKLRIATVRATARRFPVLVTRFLRALRAVGPADALLLHYKKEQLMTRFVPRRLAERVVWAEWGPLPPDFRTGLPRQAYVANAKRVSAVVCVSEGTRRTIVDAGVPAEKVTVVPNLVDVSEHDFDPEARERFRAEWGVEEGTFVVGCVARFQARKRNDVLVDALEHLDGDVVVVLAGSGPDEDELRDRAAKHGDRIRFLPTPRGYVEQLLSACDVQVFAPSPTEGASRAVILGQLARRPVIATDPEGAEDLIVAGTGTIVAPSHDPVALAGVLAQYRDDPERRAREGAAARAYALDRFDPEKTLDAWWAALSRST